jgi:hypothetical protein
MSITVGGLTIRALQQVPFAHVGDALTGRTARSWPVQCVLSPADWLTLDGIYATWRAARIADPDTMVSLSVGSTVACSGTVRGMTWNNVAAWFTSPPQPTALGAMVGVSFELVDAAQQLAILTREDEIAQSIEDNESTFGTYSLGGVTLQLTAQPDGHEDGPSLELAGTGTHVIRGPLVATRVKRLQGWTNTAGAGATIRTWYESAIAAVPAAASWFPIAPPVIDQTPVIVAGARVTRTLVSVDLAQVR